MTNFRKLPHIPLPEELMDIAYSRASKAAWEVRTQKRAPKPKVALAEEARIKTASLEVRNVFQKALDQLPKVDELPPFYSDLMQLVVDMDRFRKSLGALGWVIKKTREFEAKTLIAVRRSEKRSDVVKHRKAFYGRLSSLLRQVRGDLEYLRKASRKIRELPSIEEEFTVVIAGAPNVGKSTLLKALTGAKPRIESYPFTTQQLLLGYFERRYLRYQVIDTPGLLDRPQTDRNPIEKQGVLALKQLADVVLFVFDPSETCGFPIDYQLRLYRDVVVELGATVVPLVNKADILVGELGRYKEAIGMDFMVCSSTKGTGIAEIADRIVRLRASEQRKPSIPSGL